MEENKFKTGQEVLVRDDNNDKWNYSLFSHYSDNVNYPFTLINGMLYAQCISYQGNEYLVGTTDSLKEDLPIDTPVMACNVLTDWRFGYYAGDNNISTRKSNTLGEGNSYLINLNYIIPFDKFNPNDIEGSLKYNIQK